MTAFGKMEQFLSNLETQKWQLTDKKNVLIMQRQAKVGELDEALLTGDGAEIQAALNGIDDETAALEQRIAVFDATLSGRRRSPSLTALVQAVITESRQTIDKLQAQWHEVAGQLAPLDAQRLTLVARLGELDREAARVTTRAAMAAERLPSPKPAAPALATNVIIRHDRRAGCIFVDLQQIEKTFKGA
jgi:hypothetical protein